MGCKTEFISIVMKTIYKTDVVLFGGGVAGLWLLNHLKQVGYSAILLENESVGGIQTIHSQGVIHSGFKYQNNPIIVAQLKQMRQAWIDALQGSGIVQLTKTKIFAQKQHYWTQNKTVNTDFYDDLVGDDFKKLSKTDFPTVLKHPNYTGQVFEAAEMVLDMPSLINNLYENVADCIFKIKDKPVFYFNENGSMNAIRLEKDTIIEAQFFIFCAGAGNESLMNDLKINSLSFQSFQKMQKRPLHQVLIQKPDLPSFYGVCVSPEQGAFTPVIITTHYNNKKQKVWYLGGDIATKGVERSEKEQISFAQTEMKRLLPHLHWSDATWTTLRVDRAEPLQAAASLPTDVCVDVCMNAIQVFPVKFALMPEVADKVLTIFKSLKIKAIAQPTLPKLDKPTLLKPIWFESCKRI
jgi:glycine/D-amino acid oxidase-like deaminating enzyme